MRAMLLEKCAVIDAHNTPLRLGDIDIPEPASGQVLIKVSACAVCHTELDEIEGRTAPPHLPVVPGHQVVGRVHALGPSVTNLHVGERVGVAWIARACGHCHLCLSGNENLCAQFVATGRDVNGGYAEYMLADAAYALPVPVELDDFAAAPMLCAGAIGYRSLRLCQMVDGQRLGLTGFGASAHLVLKLAQHLLPHSEIYVFARSADEQRFARDLGATWAGDSEAQAPALLHAIIDTTPAWRPVLAALRNLAPAGRLVINAIRKEVHDQQALLQLDYPQHLWLEKEIKSVANVTRCDVSEFFQLGAQLQLRPELQIYTLSQANRALVELKGRQIRGAKVLDLSAGD